MKVNIYIHPRWQGEFTLINIIPQGNRYKVLYWSDYSINPQEVIINDLKEIEQA